MEEKTINNDEIEIDLQRLFRALLGNWWLVTIVAIVCAAVTFLGTFFFVTPLYQSSAMFYVNNNNLSLGDTSVSISSSDISASKSLVKSYIVILQTRETLNDVIDYAGVDRTYSQVKGMISAGSVDSTEIFKVIVTSPDPAEAEKIADAIAYILPKRITSIIEGTSAKVVDSAILPSSPSSPSYTKNTLIGFLVGFVLACAVIVIHELMDVTIRTEEDIAQVCAQPVLAAVPEIDGNLKNSHYYGRGGKKGSYAKTNAQTVSREDLVGGGLNFAASEAYKLLRTKLQFSFADEGECKVIGVSSALVGEGKSLSAINLAYSISQLGKKVLLIDSDMRRPSLPEKIPIRKAPGLSDYLAGQIHSEELFQPCGLKGEEEAFTAISAGRMPPNPMELISSARMEKLITRLRGSYDYIILDLPPVSEVGDALAAAKLTDGILLVVRQNYCDRLALGATIRQFEFIGCRILGVVFNGTSEDDGTYGKKYYKKGYKRGYYYGYGKHYYRKSPQRVKSSEQ